MDQSDCGVACMAMVLKYYGKRPVLENLRNKSGTTKKGTTMLGLYQAAPHLGFDAKGYESDIVAIKSLYYPVILHTVKNKYLQHYIVVFCYDNGFFVVGDPAEEGVRLMSEEELQACWRSQALLSLKPLPNFQETSRSNRQELKWIIDLVREDVSLLSVVAIIGLLITALGLSTALYSQKLIDEILPEKDIKKLMVGIALLTLLLLFRGFMQYIRGSMLVRQSKDFNIRIIEKFYKILLKLPKTFFDHRKTGDLISRMNDTARIQRTVSLIAGSLMIDLLLVLVSCVFMFNYDLWLGLAVLIAIGAFSILGLRYGKLLQSSQREVLNAYAHNESNYVDTIQGIEAIKSFNKEDFFAKNTSEIYGNFQEKAFVLGKIETKYGFINELCGTLFTMILIGYLSYSVVNGDLLVGEMVALLSVSSGIIPSMIKICMANIQLKEAQVAFNRMYEFAELDPEVICKNDNSFFEELQALSIKKLTFSFPGTSSLLQDISIELKRGEWVALIGESGGGKSTLFQLVQRFYELDAGSILFNGHNIKDMNLPSLRGKIGIVPQHVKLFNGTVLDNISMGEYELDPQSLIEKCSLLGFDTLINQFPNGFQTIVGEEGMNMSGGQVKLIALARALVKNPEVLLLDEAFSAMGREYRHFSFELIQRIKHKTAILMATHDINTALKTDRIYLLENGKITDEGKPSELLSRDNILKYEYQEIVSSC